MPRKYRASVSLIALALVTAAPAMAADDTAADDNVFSLGEMTVYGQQDSGPQMSTSILTSDEMRTFNLIHLDDAVNLIPGVTASNSGGSRNERLINVRGFDRFQVPIYIDGIRVYLPADNRLDFGRFLTNDVAAVQVAKGYVSVLDGPGGMGGAINLVTSKPTEKLEGEFAAGLDLDRSLDYGGANGFARLGTRQGKFYAQASGSWTERNHFTLSKGFTPTPSENGGEREFSDTEDWRINLKAGYTPNETDEYSVSYTKQEGDKSAPASTTDSLDDQRYWDWPYWDIESLYWLSNTQLDAGSELTLKTRAYYNGFDNGLYSYDDFARTQQTRRYAFRSYYDDEAYGGSVQLGGKVMGRHSLTAALHYRRDEHVEWQDSFGPAPMTEPRQTTTEDTYSAALETTLRPSDDIDVVAGVSYDWRDLKRAEDWTDGDFVYYPLANSHAWNWQGAVIYRPGTGSRVYANISSRTRFPTLFERFSSRFGGATSNPDLKSERALNLETGVSQDVTSAVSLDAAIFYSDISNLVQSVPIVYQGENLNQSQNVGDGEFYGVEFSATVVANDWLTLGGNYTFTHRHITDEAGLPVQPTGVPTHKAFLYAQAQAMEKLTITPSVEIASSRWTSTSDGSLYYKTGSFALLGVKAAYAITDQVEVAAGVRNLLDENYQLTDGFPEAGRSYYLTTRLKF
jgi:iron complex outermembrane receptor protein